MVPSKKPTALPPWAFVQEAHAVFQGLFQTLFACRLEMRSHGFVAHVQKALGLIVGGRMEEQIDGRHSCLFPVGDEHDNRLLRTELLDGLIDGTTHGQQTSRTMMNIKALNHQFQRNRSNVRTEIEQTGRSSNPFAHILGIRQGGC